MKNMLLFKKANTFMFWCVALLLLCGSGKGYSQLLLTEDFSYGATAGNLQTIASPNWAAHSGTSNYVQYSTTGLTFSGHAGSGVGGGATISSSGVGDHNRTFTSQTSGTVYMSCLVRITAATASNDYILHFNSGTFNARVLVQLSGSNIRFGISKAGTPVVATTNYNLSTTYMVVVKYTFITGTTTNDTCDLWVLPAFASTEALAGAPLQSTSAGTDATALNAVSIRQGTPPTGSIDAFRVGNTWADIAPSASLINGGATATAFSTTYGTASASQTFPVSGTLLTNPLVATAQTGFEVSRNDVVSYGATATYTAAEANAGGVSFLVRLKNNANAISYNAQNAVVLSSSPAPNANIVTSASGNTVTPLGLTITGLSAQDKTFDGNNTASLTGGATLNGVLFSDDVVLGGTPSATFSSAAVGTWPVTVTGYSISGTKAANYSLSQPTVANATINPSALIDQVITFPALSSVPYGTTSVSLLATSDNPGGNPITYISSNTNVATISGSTAVIVGAGTTIITASQAGDVTHNPAINKTQSLTVTPLAITLNGISALDKPYDGTTTATLTGTPVLSPAPINGDGANITIAGTPVANFATSNVGTQAVTVTGYSITGTKAGNYTFSQPTVANATITALTQTITFNTIPSLNTLTGTVTLTAVASSALTVTFESSDTNVATISGNVLTVVGSGPVTITAKQAGNSNYAAAPDVAQTRTVETALYLNQFTGTSACPTQGNVATVAANTTGAAATRSTVTCSNLNNFFSSTTLNVTSSIVNTSYIEFSATAATGYRLNLTKLSFLRSGSGTAPNQLEVRYSTDGFATSTSMSNAALTTTTATTLTWDFTDFNTPISGTITFRLYPYGNQRSDLVAGAAAASGTFRIDDVTIYGTVVVPPPTVTTTSPPAVINDLSATLGGNVTAGSQITGNGVVFSVPTANTNPTIGGFGVTNIANGSPSTGTGAFSVPSGVLQRDTQYYYNAYATNLQGTSYGSVATFYTAASTPVTVPFLSGETTSSLVLFVYEVSSPNYFYTQFVIRVVSGANTYYLQANNTLGVNPVWQTAAQWENSLTTLTVTGLTSNTSYTFDIKARNGAGVETAFGPSTTIATLEDLNPNLALTSAAPSFGNVCTTGTNNFGTTSFTLNGFYLDASDLSVASSSGELSFSTSQNGTYSNPLSVSHTNPTMTSKVVWVKLTPSATGAFSGTVAITGGGLASAFNVTATGTGINTPVTVTTGAISSITTVGATIAGTAVAGCSAVTATGIEYSIFSDFSSATQIVGSFPIALTTLSPNTLYYVRAYATDASAAGIAYGSSSSFTTLGFTTGPVATAATSITGNSFTANWESVPGAESYLLDVSTNPNFLGALTTVANWSFPNAVDDAVIDAGISANNGKVLTTVGGVGTITYVPISSSTTSAASGATWDSGSGTKYWQIDISTAGYSDLKLSSAQRSSGTGPRDFKVQYSVNAGANWFDVSGATITVGNNWTTGVLSDIALPAACDNKTSVRLRWIMTSNTNVSGATVAGTGTSGIDSIIVTGRPPSFTVYEGLSVNGLSQLVSGLAELTQYHYRVRAFSTNSTSGNSNVIHVTTIASPPTFDSVSYSGATVCDGANGTFDVSGLTPNVASRIYYDINGGTTQNILTTVADGTGAATFVIPLPLSANFQLLTITLVERADASSSLVVESNNIVFITGIAANVTYYADVDTDTYGNPAVSQTTCTGAPSGFVTDNTDCNDGDITKHASYPFYTDGDGDGYGTGTTTTSLCAVNATTPPVAGYSATNTDCNDTNINIYQFATFYVDADGDTYGSSATASVCSGLTTPTGYSTTNDDCDDTNATLNPTNPCATGKIVNLTLFVESYYIGGSTMNSVKLNQGSS
uniref:beta strand repeat-containing protein n=1 Tax=Flavobacterium sp. TaxID=239 RepID=UPI00286D3C63